MEALKQKGQKLGTQTGSLINHLMSHNSTMPKVGEGATILSWTDRHAYEVIAVSEDSKKVTIQQYKRKITPESRNLPYGSDLEYVYDELYDWTETIVWKNNAWRREYEVIRFVKGYEPTKEDRENSSLWDEQGLLKIVEGKTKKKKEWSKINILWGTKDEYYDPCF